MTRLGSTVDGKYRIVSLIGEGGMSAVYEALHLAVGRPVALKILDTASPDDEEIVCRLKREARVVSAIGHPNICEIYDLGTTEDGHPYLVMERLLGETLAQRLDACGPMSFVELAPIIKPVLAALGAAHAKGVIHRDLKPENVFIEEWRQGGRLTCKLLDFGIATSMPASDFGDAQRLTQTGWVMGTPYYMAPEQARGDSTLDHRADLWAVAVLAYQALTGRRPFVATNYNALLVKILTSQPRSVQKLRPGTPDAVAAMLAKGLAKLREDRFQTAREFLDAVVQLERICTVEDPQAPTLIMRRSPRRRASRSPRSREPDRSLFAIDDPPRYVDDEATDIDGGLHARHTGSEDHGFERRTEPAAPRSKAAAQPLSASSLGEAVFGDLPLTIGRRPSALDAESETRQRPDPRLGQRPVRPEPKSDPSAERKPSRSEDTATTLVVSKKPRS